MRDIGVEGTTEVLTGISDSASEVIHAPRWPSLGALALGFAALIAGAACIVLDAAVVIAAVGYLIGCIGAVALGSVHRARESKSRSNPKFRLQPHLWTQARIGMVLGIVGGLVCAFFIATELAK